MWRSFEEEDTQVLPCRLEALGEPEPRAGRRGLRREREWSEDGQAAFGGLWGPPRCSNTSGFYLQLLQCSGSFTPRGHSDTGL